MLRRTYAHRSQSQAQRVRPRPLPAMRQPLESLSHSSAYQAAKASCMAPRRDLCHQADGATADGIRTSRRLRAARLHAQPLFCDPDSLLCVIAVDLPAFQQLYETAWPPRACSASAPLLVMESVVENRASALMQKPGPADARQTSCTGAKASRVRRFNVSQVDRSPKRISTAICVAGGTTGEAWWYRRSSAPMPE